MTNPGPAISTLRTKPAAGPGGHEALGDLARLRLERLGERERQVGRDVPVRRILGAFENDVRRGRAKLRRRLRQRRAERVVCLHLSELESFLVWA